MYQDPRSIDMRHLGLYQSILPTLLLNLLSKSNPCNSLDNISISMQEAYKLEDKGIGKVKVGRLLKNAQFKSKNKEWTIVSGLIQTT